jgi:Spy/CpxP family protein refolding chaperone
MHRLITNGKGKSLLLIISLAFNLGACLAVAVQASGDRKPGPPWGEGRRHRERPSNKLNLSPEQKEIVSAARDQFFDELHTLKGRMHEESGKLADLLTTAEVDMDAVSDQADRVATVRNEIQWRMIQHLLSVREVLEPGQLESFKEFAGQILSRSGRGRSHGGRPSRHDLPDRKP